MSIKLEFASPEFFSADPKKVKAIDEGTGRVYFVYKNRILAVGKEG